MNVLRKLTVAMSWLGVAALSGCWSSENENKPAAPAVMTETPQGRTSIA